MTPTWMVHRKEPRSQMFPVTLVTNKVFWVSPQAPQKGSVFGLGPLSRNQTSSRRNVQW